MPNNSVKTGISFNKSHLQLIAILAMVTDHVAWAFVDFWTPLGQVMHVFGRLTIPIMCFFIAEGFRRTHDLYRYIGRLAVFDVISIIPFYFFFGEEYGYRQNILFDHLLSLLILTALESRKLKKWQKLIIVPLLFVVSATIGGWPLTPALFTLAFYYGRNFKEKAKWFIYINVLTFAITSAFAVINQHVRFAPYDWTWYDRAYLLGFMLALPILARYNGEKGKSIFGRYFFYSFYPIHLTALCIIKYIVSGQASNYKIYLWLHLICFLIVFIMLVKVIQGRPSKMQSAVVMFLVLESFYIVGFIIEIFATTVETFYMACVVEYFGELLMLVAFLIFASQCGRIRIPLFIYVAHVIAALVLVYSIITTPETGFFYSEIILTTLDGHTKAEYVHATGYYLSVAFILVIIAEMVYIMINSLIKGTKIEKRRVAMLFGAVMFIWIPYAITLTGITGGYEVPVIGVVGAAIFLTLCFYKFGTLDSVAIVSESALAKAGEGVIIIDDRHLVSFSNTLAKGIVGEEALSDKNADENEIIKKALDGNLSEIEHDGKVYEVRVEELKHGAYTQGYTIWFLDATKHRALLDEAQNMANHDSLTGIYNRRHFETLVISEIEQKKTGTLLISDMDNFKTINDTYGHKRGDNVLCEYAKILMDYSEEVLLPCRIGGDEFMFYLKEITDPEKIETIIKRIMKEFDHRFRNDQVKCTLSIGAAINGDPANLKDFGALYRIADKNLYSAKGNGKNTYVM